MLKRDLGTGDLCDNIGLVGVSAKLSYVTASPSHHDQAIPIMYPLHVGHPYITLFRIFDLLVYKGAIVGLTQRRYDKDHVMPHAYINERVLGLVQGLFKTCNSCYYPLLGGCYVYSSTINLLQPAQGDKVTISPVVRVCI